MLNIQAGQKIRELREIQNYTWESFAEKVEISVKFLYEIEQGKRDFQQRRFAEFQKPYLLAVTISCWAKKKDIAVWKCWSRNK